MIANGETDVGVWSFSAAELEATGRMLRFHNLRLGAMGTGAAPLWERWWNTKGESGEEPPEEIKEYYQRLDAHTLMIDCRGTPSRRASLSSDAIIHTGKSTFTRLTLWPGLRARRAGNLITNAATHAPASTPQEGATAPPLPATVMSDAIEVFVDHDGQTPLVGRCRYIARRHGQSSVFEYADAWRDRADAFALDPANLPLELRQIYTSSGKSALPGALRDTAPDRWGRQLIRRAFRKAGEQRTLSEIDYLLAINDQTRIGALRYRREGEETFDHDIGRYRVPPLIRLPALLNAADAVLSNAETAEDLRLLLNEGSPLGGARPKSAVGQRHRVQVIGRGEAATALGGWQHIARGLRMSASDLAVYATAIRDAP